MYLFEVASDFALMSNGNSFPICRLHGKFGLEASRRSKLDILIEHTGQRDELGSLRA